MAHTITGSNVKKMTPSPATADLVTWLKSPRAYPDRPARVDCRETHISWVFLADRHAYKLKKPVRFDFLDFSTPALRRKACEAEVRLNQRMAKGVYLAVVPITIEPGGQLALGGHGGAIDWLVKMRRLPAERMLDELIRRGRLTSPEIERLANHLAQLYHTASPMTVGAAAFLRAIEQHVRANRCELLEATHELSAIVVKRVHAAQLRFLRLESEEFEARVCDGRIIDGHGDLRPEHICLEGEPVIFDCIEFSDEFRRIDVADELSFLAMECDVLGAESVGRCVLDAYRRVSHDSVSDRMLHFYKSYRACVRSKVKALAATQAAAATQAGCAARCAALEQARNYLSLADTYARSLGPPLAIVVTGLMGSGKSTLAESLAEVLGAELVETDRVRRELYGRSDLPAGFNQGTYRSELRDRVYDEVLDRARKFLGDGLSVVVDGTFLSTRHRQRAVAESLDCGAVPFVVRCTCADDIALERISRRAAERSSFSDARPELYARQRNEYEPDPPGAAVLDVDTTTPLRLQESAVFERLRQLLSR
jgi:aminoglycoside phosphotransferase family enzyme/predicted kinase